MSLFLMFVIIIIVQKSIGYLVSKSLLGTCYSFSFEGVYYLFLYIGKVISLIGFT